MAWPSGAVDTTDTDSGTDNPANARADLLDLEQKVNQIIGHVSAYIQTLLDDADAPMARATLGLAALAIKATIATGDIDADAVTYAKMQNVSATDKLLGRSAAGAGDVEEIACTSAARSILDDATVAAILATLGGAPLDSPTFTGNPKFTMGAGSGTAPLVGVANVNTTAVGNVGAGPNDLMTYTLPANSLSVNGKAIRVHMWGKFANNANAKTVQIFFGSGVLVSPFAVISTDSSWDVIFTVARTGANTQDYVITSMTANRTTNAIQALIHIPNTADGATLAETDTSMIVIKAVAATSTANNDIVQEGMVVEFLN